MNNQQLAAEHNLPGLCFWRGSFGPLVQLADRYHKPPTETKNIKL